MLVGCPCVTLPEGMLCAAPLRAAGPLFVVGGLRALPAAPEAPAVRPPDFGPRLSILDVSLRLSLSFRGSAGFESHRSPVCSGPVTLIRGIDAAVRAGLTSGLPRSFCGGPSSGDLSGGNRMPVVAPVPSSRRALAGRVRRADGSPLGYLYPLIGVVAPRLRGSVSRRPRANAPSGIPG